ncbi:unnamed protein product [Amoebophrya sp. A120]|nr:unnamed protein product [Amoebophrya sp. A120]|eukprot:GSA120T00017278001.1
MFNRHSSTKKSCPELLRAPPPCCLPAVQLGSSAQGSRKTPNVKISTTTTTRATARRMMVLRSFSQTMTQPRRLRVVASKTNSPQNSPCTSSSSRGQATSSIGR